MSQKPTPAPTAESKPHPLTALLTGTCVRYTAISLFVLLVNLLFSGNEDAYVHPSSFLLLLPFALGLSAAATVRKADKLATGARVVLHPLLSLGSFYLCIYLPYQLDKRPSAGQILAILVLGAVVYGVAVTVLLLLARRTRQKTIDDTPYISQFGRKS